jgi:hypothetical protein
MIPIGLLSHHSKERIRIRIPHKRQDISYFAFLHACFEKMAEVRAVETNPFLGSLLLITSLGAEDIFAYAELHKLFHKLDEPIGNAGRSENLLVQATQAAKRLDQQLKDSTNGMIDLKTVACGAFAGLCIYQIAKGQVLASASSLMMSALTFFPRNNA